MLASVDAALSRQTHMANFFRGVVDQSHGARYLALIAHSNPADARTHSISGNTAQGGEIAVDWGLHLVDINADMGGLITSVASLERAEL